MSVCGSVRAMSNPGQLPFGELHTALRAAAEATRLRVLALLAEAELTVSDLTEILRQSQPRISRHLRLLSEAGLIERYREGSWAFFRLAERGGGAEVARVLIGRLDPADPVVTRDRERLAEVRAARAAAAQAYFRAHAAEWDRIRRLHVADVAVEAAIRSALAERPLRSLLDLGTGTGRVLEHQVLHYLDDGASAIREAARVLRPGGALLVVDFAPHDLEFLREEHAHLRLGFAAETVTQWSTAAGLDMVLQETLAPEAGSEGKIAVSLWLARDPRIAFAGSAREVA